MWRPASAAPARVACAPSITVPLALSGSGEGGSRDCRSSAAGFAGHSVAATLKLFQKCGETFRDRLVGDIVLRSEPSPDCPQPWPSGQNVTRFGLARLTLPALAPTDFSAARGVLSRALDA